MTKVKAEKIVANLIKPQKGESSFVSNDQIVSGKSEKEALRLEIEDPELANDNGGEKEVDPVQYLKEKFSLEKDDVFNLEKLRKEMAETVSGEKPLSEEERLRLRNLVGKRLGVYQYSYINSASVVRLEVQELEYKKRETDKKDFLKKVYKDLSGIINDPILVVVEKMKQPSQYHQEFISPNDPEVIDFSGAAMSSPLMGFNGMIVYRGNGVDFMNVLQKKADEEFDFSEIGINDLQPRWVTPRPVDALGYTIAKKRQVRIYDFTKVNDIFRYDIHQNRTHDGEFMAGESVVAHNGYTDEDAKKLKLGKFSKQKLAHELIKDYKNNQQPNYVEIENVNTGKVGRIPMPKKSDLGDNEYVMRNKDLKEHLSAVYEAIDGG